MCVHILLATEVSLSVLVSMLTSKKYNVLGFGGRGREIKVGSGREREVIVCVCVCVRWVGDLLFLTLSLNLS